MPLVWPAGIVSEQLAGITDVPQDERVRTQMDAGPPKIRARFTASIRTISIPYRMTGAERVIFDTFWTTTLSNGTLSFEWEDPLDDSTISYQFASKPQFKLSLGNSNPDLRLWETVLVLEVLP